MCGIVGILRSDGEVSPASLDAGLNALHHRGPDGRGRFVEPQVGLGHARLSIIDLATGAQPIANEDGSLHIVANGEFYDFEAIRRDLERRGHRFRTRSDSEIALHLYEELGPECVHRLRGEFAFLVWDGRNRRLLAARDRFGVKPLFYAEHDGALYFGSEVKALFAMGVPAAWSAEAVFGGGYVMPGERTLYRGVRQVPPGHFLRATREGHRLHCYWDVDYPHDDATAVRDEREVVEGFRAVLEDAVKTRLRADVPVSCYLSGGLDSCAVLGLASLHHDGPVRAYTLTFEDPAYDEGPVAEEMAARAGAEYRPIPIAQADLAVHFRDAVLQAELPCMNAHGVAKYLLSRAVRNDGRKVVLTGEGSDEILAGYPHFRRDMLLHHRSGQDPAEVERLVAELEAANQVSRGLLLPEGETDPAAVCEALLGFVPSFIDAQTALTLRLQRTMRDDFLAEHRGTELVGSLLSSIDVRGRLQGRNAVHAALYLWAKTGLANYVLTNLGDRMEMAHSIEGRVPFMDHHVAEYLHDVPVSLKIRGMREKHVLRESVRELISETVYERQKHPFLSPPATMYPNGELHELLHDTLRGSMVDAVPFFDRRKLARLLDEAADPGLEFEGRVVADQVLMMALSIVFLQDGLRPGI
jgi:asparagine synthase (glutamine-hydrolysing)